MLYIIDLDRAPTIFLPHFPSSSTSQKRDECPFLASPFQWERPGSLIVTTVGRCPFHLSPRRSNMPICISKANWDTGERRFSHHMPANNSLLTAYTNKTGRQILNAQIKLAQVPLLLSSVCTVSPSVITKLLIFWIAALFFHNSIADLNAKTTFLVHSIQKYHSNVHVYPVPPESVVAADWSISSVALLGEHRGRVPALGWWHHEWLKLLKSQI